MRKSLFLVALMGATANAGPAFGLGDVIGIKLRADGRYNVACSNGEVEKGVSKNDLFAGRVCEEVGSLDKVAIKAMDFSGDCSASSFYMEDKVVGSHIRFVGLSLSPNDYMKGCSGSAKFKIPEGYKMGGKNLQVRIGFGGLARGRFCRPPSVCW